MRRTVLLFAGILIFTTTSIGQINMSGSGLESDYQNIRDTKRQAELSNQSKMRQSKMSFYMNDWEAGMTYLNDNNVLTGRLYRYNIYTDQIEAREVIDPNEVQIVSIGSKKFIHTNYMDEGVESDGYFELLVLGDCKLLIKRKLKFDMGSKYVEAYGTDDSFKVVENYYIQKGDTPAFQIDKDKADLIDALSDKDQIVQFIHKRSKLFMNEKKMIEIVSYYNKI